MLKVDFRDCSEECKEKLNKFQFYIGSYMMACGIGEITEENVNEVYARLLILHTSSDVHLEGEPWMTYDMVKLLVGAKFNVAYEKASVWSTRMYKCVLREVERNLDKQKEVA